MVWRSRRCPWMGWRDNSLRELCVRPDLLNTRLRHATDERQVRKDYATLRNRVLASTPTRASATRPRRRPQGDGVSAAQLARSRPTHCSSIAAAAAWSTSPASHQGAQPHPRATNCAAASRQSAVALICPPPTASILNGIGTRRWHR